MNCPPRTERFVAQISMGRWAAVAACIFSSMLLSAHVMAEAPLSIEQARVTVTGYDVNRPDPYPGMGDFGWVGNVRQMPGGDLLLVHQWGYWHSSFAEPRIIEEKRAAGWRAQNWPLDFPAPTGGRSMITRSTDNGLTWSKPQTIVDLPQDDSPYGLLRCADGTLLCFINVQASWYGFTKAPEPLQDQLGGLNTQQCVIRSTDNGQTWSEPIWLESPGKFYERSHGQPLQLPDGGILWPTYYSDAGTQAQLSGAIHRSDDSGKTWRLISRISRDKMSVDEPAIARLADGRLIMVCRPDGCVFHSKDDGVTWTESGLAVKQGRFKAPWIDVLSDGTVVCVVTLGNMRVVLSSDHGQTWTDPIPLDTSCYGYPGGTKLADDSIITSYVSSGRAPSRIHVVRFRPNAVRDGIVLLPLGEYTEDPDLDAEP